jgi:AcrR family transcriptional regulator
MIQYDNVLNASLYRRADEVCLTPSVGLDREEVRVRDEQVATRPARRSRHNTRARLVEAAVAVFAERPFGRVTVDHLVGAAGFTRGAFYSNFSSIEELFHAVYTHQADLMIREVNHVLDRLGTGELPPEALAEVFAALHPYGRTWFTLHQEYTLLAVRDAEARELFLANVDQFEDRMEELVGRMLRLLDREPTLPLAQIRDVMLALYLHGLGTEQLGTGGLDTDDLVVDVVPRLLLGLSHPRSS